jgi:hypothetical protein
MKQLMWNSQMVSNFDIRCDHGSWGDWEWLKRPVVDVMTQVEKWDVLVRLITLVKRGNLIEIRAYFPIQEVPTLKETLKSHPRILDDDRKIPKFERAVWCLGCRKKTIHDLDTCRVADIMES